MFRRLILVLLRAHWSQVRGRQGFFYHIHCPVLSSSHVFILLPFERTHLHLSLDPGF